jgi:hypothetical protein
LPHEASGVVEELPVGTDVIQSKQEIDIAENDYVAAIYQRKWYIGKVFSSDESDRTVEISFMVQSKEFFKWPERSDVIWLDVHDVLNVATPTNYTIAGCLADIHLAVTICRHGMEAHCSRNGF